MIGMRVSGIGTVQLQLRNIAQRVPENARKTMARGAEHIVELAKRMTPEDTGALADSIRIEKGYEMGSGRLFINVVVANRVITLPNGRSVDLNQYALIIHENYSMMNPGENTRAKQAANPDIIVGERFMTRAAAMHQPKLVNAMIQTVKQIIDGETQT